MRGQRLGFGLAHISLGIGVPQCERHGRQRGTRRILRLLFEDDTVIVEAMRKGSNATRVPKREIELGNNPPHTKSVFFYDLT